MSAPGAALAAVRPGALAERAGRSDLLLLLAVLAVLLLLYWQTAAAMVALWLRSETFTHGFAIPPISAWLVWRRRAALAALPRRPAGAGLAALLLLGAAWLLATVANVQVLQQYLFVAMLPAAVLALSGPVLTRALAFPLGYLLLAVPFGEVFVPPLMDFTARFTAAALRLSAIPVFLENNYLSLPSGNWSVVEACSGLRYVIASVALGALYAYLNYRSRSRRLAFMAAALLLPVLANGVRAYLIVLVGHFSDMRLAVGIDHLVYGWIFFGLVSLLLFWIGARWRQAPAAGRPAAPAPAAPRHGAATARAAAACVLLAALWPPLAAHLLARPAPAAGAGAPLSPAPLPLAPPPPWHASPLAPDDWHVLHAGQPRRYSARLSDGTTEATLQLSWYASQAKGAELLTPVRRRVEAGLPQWHELATSVRSVRLGGRTLRVRATIVQAAERRLLVWRWYRQTGVELSSPQLLKLMLAKNKLFGEAEHGAEIAVAAPFDERPEQAEPALRALLEALLPSIDESLRHAAR
ncbi:exosortase A [Rugamonas sp. DEMB1]|uniref:exosortase A n=1 Tax=Rugamonas sp. DEMB1 TaxID=3039386 RepID=UPI00244D03B0|nr:exosortase A [Rugamonas sp. DEMB1]WGG52996.1 exosortase A [Rugamonas sp. DEMB1]